MSVQGRNQVNGSTVTTYRGTKTPGTGGQTSVSWSATLTAIKWELHQLTSDILRQVFGAESQVELVAYDKQDVDVLPQDAVVVTAGRYAGSTFRVQKTRRSRKHLEIGLKLTPETVP